MTAPSRSLKELFLAALEVAPENRAAWLQRECGADTELRDRLGLMLAAHDSPQSLLDRPGPSDAVPRVFTEDGGATTDSSAAVRTGTVIGPYKLLQEIGEGGMGVVYLAEQHEPVKRRVALKIIKPGMDTRQVIARFEAERQALSLMDHPNIAKVLDAGTTESGRPFFVMELVKGQPITQYCDEHHLTPRQRLELLLPVCQAIQHAHQKGIIHRDIKPTNILIAEYDQQPVPKVIDFGVAKAISQSLTEKTMFTGLGQIVGTLEYMSPEQAKVNQLDIDTRSDIYSLGVLLYELLTGSTPFDKQRLRSAGWDEMLRIIREEEPPKPSTRLSSVETLPSIAANRNMQPARLGRTVRGELDWIVMKALEKDRNRRYETANGLAMDIQRYLSDEPVVACPPSAGYRLRKFVRRNKVSVLASIVTLVALIGVAGASVVAATIYQRMAGENLALAWDLKRALGDAELNLAQAKEKEQLARTNLALAMVEQERAEVNLDVALKALDAVYLDAVGKDKLLGNQSANRERMGGKPAASLTEQEKELLRRGLEFYKQFAHQNSGTPRAEARTAKAFFRVGLLQATIEESEVARASLQEAILRFKRLTEQFPAEADYPEQLGDAYLALGGRSDNSTSKKDAFQAANSAFTRAIELRPDTADLFARRALVNSRMHAHRVALADYEHALQLDPEAAIRHTQLAHEYNWCTEIPARDYTKALQHAQRAAELAPKDAMCHALLAEIYIDRFDDHTRGLNHVRLSLELQWNTWALRIRGMSRFKRGEYIAALGDFNEVFRRDPNDTWTCVERARVLQGLKRFDEALTDYNRALELDPKNTYALRERAGVHIVFKEYEKALTDLAKQHALTPKWPYGWKTQAHAEFFLGRHDDALRSLRKSSELGDDLSFLIWIPLDLVAQCPSQSFRDGLMALADEAVEKDPKARSYRAIIAIHLGQWGKARDDMAELAKAGSAKYDVYYRLALVSLAEKNQERYRDASSAMLAQFADSKVVEETNFTVWTAALAPQAVDDYEPAIAMARRCLELDNGNSDSIRSLGAILYRAGDLEEAAKMLRPLTAAPETSVAPKSSPAYPLFFLAMAQQRLGKAADARALLERATELTAAELYGDLTPLSWIRKLTLELLHKESATLLGLREESDLSNPAHRKKLADNRIRRGDDLRRQTRFDEAEQEYQRALLLLQTLRSEFPDKPYYRARVAWVQRELSSVLREGNRQEAANELLRQSIENWQVVVQERPDVPKHRFDLGHAYRWLAIHLGPSAQAEERGEAWRQSVVHLRAGLSAALAPGGYRPHVVWLADSQRQLADLLAAQSRSEEAHTAYRQAVEVLASVNSQPFIASAELSQVMRESAATCFDSLITLLTKAQRNQEAKQVCQEAIGFYERLAAESPGELYFREELAKRRAEFAEKSNSTD